MHRAVDQRLAEFHAGVVEQITRGEIVGAVDDDIDAVEQALHVVRGHALPNGLDLRPRIQRRQRGRGGVDLRRTDAGLGVQDLACLLYTSRCV